MSLILSKSEHSRDDIYSSSLHYILLQPSNSGFSFITEKFLLFLSNKDIGKLDITLSDKDMRRAFYSRLGSYYSFNDIHYKGELEFLAKRNIALTRCVIDFCSSAYPQVPIVGNKCYPTSTRISYLISVYL